MAMFNLNLKKKRERTLQHDPRILKFTKLSILRVRKISERKLPSEKILKRERR